MKWEDGFSTYWDPQVLKKDDIKVRIIKPHGSVLWFELPGAQYVKSILIPNPKVKWRHITGEQADPLMLYPGTKTAYSPVFIELMKEAEDALKNPSCRLLVCIGYSFRDKHMLDMVFNAAMENTQLQVVLISPSAYETYHTYLTHYGYKRGQVVEGTFSPLHGRVLLVDSGIETVLGSLSRLITSLDRTIKKESNERQKATQGEKPAYNSVYDDYLRLGAILHAHKLTTFEDIQFKETGNGDATIRSALMRFWNARFLLYDHNRTHTEAIRHFTQFVDALTKILVEGCTVEVSRGGSPDHKVQVGFAYRLGIHDLLVKFIDPIASALSRGARKVPHEKCSLCRAFIKLPETFDRLSKYMEGLGEKVYIEDTVGFLKAFVKKPKLKQECGKIIRPVIGAVITGQYDKIKLQQVIKEEFKNILKSIPSVRWLR